jgi:hypothetical protein
MLRSTDNPALDRPIPMPADHPLEPLLRLAGMALLVAVLSAAWRRVVVTHEQRRLDKPKALPEKLQVWEGEGGQSQMPGLPRG